MTSRRTSILLPAILCTLSLFVSGCASLGTRLEPPKASLAGIRVLESRPLETVFLTELRVINTNEVPLVIKGLDCDMEINDRSFAIGLADEAVEVPAFGTAIVRVKAYSSMLEVVASVLDMIREHQADKPMKAFRYRLEGRLRLGGNALPKILPFTSEGEFSFEGLTPPQEKKDAATL